jgi:hypothetical protein
LIKVISAVMLLTFAGVKVYLNQPEHTVALAQSGPRRSPPSFDLRRTTIPRAEIFPGGPPKDGIPALTNPAFLAADAAKYLRPGDRVAGVVVEGEARAYPLRILTWHEVVNDSFGGVLVAVTYCPLCDSVAVFDRRTLDGMKEFGVSGLLYNSNVLVYDRRGKPEALWSQLKARAVSGPRADQTLKPLPVELTTWADWRERHPGSKVLSTRTGFSRDYRKDPYAGYFGSPGLMFPVRPLSDRFPEKTKVLGVWTEDGTAKAYPLSTFAPLTESRDLQDEVGGGKLTLRFDAGSNSLRVVDADQGLHWIYALWFAWYAFHPDTMVYSDH